MICAQPIACCFVAHGFNSVRDFGKHVEVMDLLEVGTVVAIGIVNWTGWKCIKDLGIEGSGSDVMCFSIT